MPMLARISSLWRNLVQRRDVERALDDEMAAYVALLAAEKVREGLSPSEARRLALIEIGGVTQVKEAVRRARIGGFVDDVARDLAFGWRMLRRSPGVTFVSLAILAVGIGVNAAFFAYVDFRLTRPQPGVTDTDGLVRVYVSRPERVSQSGRARRSDSLAIRPLNEAEFWEFRDRQTVLESVGALNETSILLDVDGVAERSRATIAAGGYFSQLRVRMQLGRGFPDVDERVAPPDPSVIVSDRLWRSRLGGTPDVLGRVIRVNGARMAVVGVLPPRYPGGEVWLPFAAAPLIFPKRNASLDAHGFSLVGRLRPGVSIEQATQALSAVTTGIGGMHSRTGALGRAFVHPFAGPGLGSSALGGMATSLATIVGVVLLITCANVAILFLGRAATRSSEIAMRLTLGAGRARLVRQLITESIVFAVIAGVLALLILYWSSGYLNARFTEMGEDLTPSWRTIVVTIVFAVGTGVLFGILPALHVTRRALADSLKRGGAGGGDRRRSRLQRAFVITEVALSVALVCAAGVFVQAVARMGARDMGFEVSHRVLLGELELATSGYSAARTDQLLDDARRGIAAIPGVQAVSFASGTPLSGGGFGYARVRAPLPTDTGRARSITGGVNAVDPGYFGAAGIRLLDGRDVRPTDDIGAVRVALVSDTLAARIWPGGSAVGKSLRFHLEVFGGVGVRSTSPDSIRDVTIVGVVASEETEPGRRRPMIYLPRSQQPDSGGMTMVVRIAPHAGGVAQTVHDELRRLDPDLVFTRLTSTKEIFDVDWGEMYDVGLAGTALGILALTLACVGVYAVIAFGVAQRSREIGIRVALGARGAQVVGPFFREGVRVIGIGLAIGAPLGFATMKLGMWSEFGIQMLTVQSVLSIMALLAIVGALASWLPARRAAAVDPLDAIRSE